MASVADSRPRHQQISAEIRTWIMNGRLAAGQQLPVTSELAAQFHVNGTTIQHALNTLKTEGFLVGEKGRGVYVRDRQPFVVDVANYFEPSPTAFAYTLLDVSEVKPPADVARALQITDGEVAVLRRRMLTHDGLPVELSFSYYPVDLAAGTRLADRRKIPGGAPQVLADLGYPQLHLIDEVSSRLPTTEEFEALELPASVPILQQFRTIRSHNQRPVEVSVLIKGGHLYSLRYMQEIH